jgi:alpha-ketoglutarate-dependent taurine dioxygenase
VNSHDLLGGKLSTDIRNLLKQRGVLLFRGINLTDEQQTAFARTIGDIYAMGDKVIQKITLDPNLSEVDSCVNAEHAKNVGGGQTEFANTYAAYDDLPDEEKRALSRVRVIHTQENIQRKLHPNPTDEQLARWRRHTPKSHPLIWTH